MKIEGLSGTYTSLQPASAGHAANGGEFAEVLARAVGKRPGVCASGQSQRPTQAQGVKETTRARVVAQVGSLLNALEAYAQALGDQSLTLKQIHPVVQRLEEETRALEQTLATHEADESLGAIAREGLAQAKAELIKFWRGEYV